MGLKFTKLVTSAQPIIAEKDWHGSRELGIDEKLLIEMKLIIIWHALTIAGVRLSN